MEVNTNFYYLVRFIAEFHREPKSREIYEGINIGYYFHNIKRGRIKTSDADKEFLERLDIDLTIKDPQEQVHEKAIILIEFLLKEQRLPKSHDVYKGVTLKVFLQNILSENTKLNSEDKKLFEKALKKASQ